MKDPETTTTQRSRHVPRNYRIRPQLLKNKSRAFLKALTLLDRTTISGRLFQLLIDTLRKEMFPDVQSTTRTSKLEAMTTITIVTLENSKKSSKTKPEWVSKLPNIRSAKRERHINS